MFKVAVEIDIDSLVKKALQIEDRRARDIVVHRFGLKSPGKRTLAGLGDEYGLTRERVRQIESATLKAIRARIEKEKHALAFLKLVESYLESVSGLRRSDGLARDIAVLSKRKDVGDPIFENKLNFLAKVLGRPNVVDESQGTHTVWHTSPESHALALDLIDKLLNTDEHDFDAYVGGVKDQHDLPESTILNYLSVSKNFDVGPYGHMGANHWLHVNPRTVRDKAYLALKQAGEPLHFRDIAEMVNEMSDSAKAHATVHNALISDPTFVLTGRGTYWLDE